MSEPRTEAGRALLAGRRPGVIDTIPTISTAAYESMRLAILAIESEAQTALLHDLNDERACFDEQHETREP